MKYTTNDLIVFALFGALIFGIELTLCPALTILSGLPASCGVAGFIVEPLLGILAAWITRKKFAFAITLLAVSVLHLTTPVILGIPNVFVLFPLTVSALASEPLIRKYTMKTSTLGGGIYLVISSIFVWALITLMGFPGAEVIRKILYDTSFTGMTILISGTIATFFVGAGGGFLAAWIYNRIKKHRFVRYIQR